MHIHVGLPDKNSMFVQYDLVRTREQLRILLFTVTKNNVSIQCHAISSYHVTVLLLDASVVRIRKAFCGRLAE